MKKSVSSITDWHHEACRVMTKGVRGGGILSIPSLHNLSQGECVRGGGGGGNLEVISVLMSGPKSKKPTLFIYLDDVIQPRRTHDSIVHRSLMISI